MQTWRKLLMINKINQKFVQTENGKYPAEWQIKQLKDVCTIIVPMRDKPKQFEGGIPWVTLADIDGKFISDSNSGQYVTSTLADEMNLKILPINTIVCSCTATIGVCSIVQKELITNQQFVGLHPTEIDRDFLYYYILSQVKNLENLAFGTVGGYIAKERFEDFQIIFPKDIMEQKLIVNTLSNLDNQIENIKQQNKILETFSYDFYKSLFGNFNEINDLNNLNSVKLPNDWSIGTLSNNSLTKLLPSGITRFDNYKIYFDTSSVKITTIVKPGKKVTMQTKPSRANMQPKNKSIWFAKMMGSKKILHFNDYSNHEIKNFILSTGFAGIESKDFAFYYILNFISSELFQMKKDKFCNGTLMDSINRAGIDEIQIIIPPKPLLEKFNKLVKPIHEKIYFNKKLISNSKNIRDTLLPKLMSGEIRV